MNDASFKSRLYSVAIVILALSLAGVWAYGMVTKGEADWGFVSTAIGLIIPGAMKNKSQTL